MKLSQLGKAAYYYAKFFNWSVFPLIPKQKEPLIKNGLLGATTDLNQIIEWWSKHPNANIGIRTGKESNIVVIDVDGKIGEQSLEQLIDHYGSLPETVESVTGSGGRHILFKYPNIENLQIKNKVNWLGENSKVDIRADGGYIVAPPSVHPNGNVYEWELSSRPNEIKIADMPNWLLNLLIEPRSSRGIKKQTNYWSTIMSGVKEGGRDNAATSLVGHLFRRYVDPAIIIEIMEMWNERNNPPLSSNDLERIIKSVWRKEQLEREKR